MSAKKKSKRTTTRKTLKKSSNSPLSLFKKHNKVTALVFIVLFAGVGSYLLFRSQAATVPLITVEAEGMTLPASASVVTDATASNSKSIQFSTNGTATTTITLPSVSDNFSISAKGVQCKGSPSMSVKIDGVQIASTSVSASSWAMYTYSKSLSAGPHTISLSFTNFSTWRKCAKQLYIDKTVFMGQDTVTPPSSSTPHGTTSLWKGDMEEGNMNDWWYPDTKEGNNGGGIYNSGTGSATISNEKVQAGSWAAKSVLADGTGGARLFRWLESRSNRDAYYSAWVYIPQTYTLTANPNTGQYWNLMQFKSRTMDNSRIDPVWALYVQNGADGKLYVKPGWGWGGTQLAGPKSTDNVSGKFYPTFTQPLPIGRWVLVEAYLHQSKDFDGRLTLWQDGQQMFDMNNIRTSYNNCNFNSWCAENEWSVDLYSDGLSPAPAFMYVDNAEIRK